MKTIFLRGTAGPFRSAVLLTCLGLGACGDSSASRLGPEGLWPAVAEVEQPSTERESVAERTVLERPSGPLLRTPEATHDWGVIAPGDELTHTFRLFNDGRDTLEIYRVKSSCGCATSDFDKQIASGEEGKVSVIVNTKKLHSGKARAIFRVLSNNPKDSEYWLILQGRVEEPELTPSEQDSVTGTQSAASSPQQSFTQSASTLLPPDSIHSLGRRSN